MSVDPVYNGPSGYVGMLNNPVSVIDPNGEEPITLGAIALAAAIGAGTSAVAYTASIALSDGGFNNWDWGQFGKGVAIGAFSGVMTFGIGEAFNTAAEVAVSASKSTTMIEVGRIATHATFQGGLSVAQGGDFWTAFGSGVVGGAVGLGTNNWESNFTRNATTIGSAMLLGGATAELTGGEFWKGATTSGIVAGANHVAHRLGDNLLEKTKQDQGGDPPCPNCPQASGGGDESHWFWKTHMGQDLSGVDWLNVAALYIGGTGMVAGASELHSLLKGEILAGAKALSRGAFFVGAGISLIEYRSNPNPTMQDGVKAGTDISYGALGAFAGPFGWFVSSMHFADQFLQSTIPGYTQFMKAGGGIGGPTYTGSDGVYVCFMAGTLIYTEDGSKPIENLGEGVKVYSYNFTTDKVELQPITKFFSREVQEVYELKVSDEQISVTEEHPFYVKGKEWVKVKDLVPGDQLRSDNGVSVEIIYTNKVKKTVTVYNIEVASNHNYFVTPAKVLVHNKSIIELENNKKNEDQP